MPRTSSSFDCSQEQRPSCAGYNGRMFNNYLPQIYHSYDKILEQAGPLGSVFIGDINAALDLEFIASEGILTGKTPTTLVITAADGLEHVSYPS